MRTPTASEVPSGAFYDGGNMFGDGYLGMNVRQIGDCVNQFHHVASIVNEVGRLEPLPGLVGRVVHRRVDIGSA